MNLSDLVNKLSSEFSIPKKQIKELMLTSLEILKESINAGEVNESIFQSPVLNIRRQVLPEVPPEEGVESKPLRKRGIIQFPVNK